MPIKPSAKKALRQSIARRAQNRKRMDAVRAAVKSYKKLVAEKKLDEAAKRLPTVYRVLDKTAKTGAIKKNRASRLKSRLAALLRAKTR
jgi:small subunit ribosomal protein S20